MIACLNNCEACKDNYTCDTCEKDFFLTHLSMQDLCTTYCLEKYYPDPLTMTCKKCDFRCLHCESDSNKKCSFCDFSINGVIRSEDSACICANGTTANSVLGICESKELYLIKN